MSYKNKKGEVVEYSYPYKYERVPYLKQNEVQSEAVLTPEKIIEYLSKKAKKKVQTG